MIIFSALSKPCYNERLLPLHILKFFVVFFINLFLITLFCCSIYSDDRGDLAEQLFIDPNTGNVEFYGCPASPTTVPARNPQSMDSPVRTGAPRRRQRTTSMNNQVTTANPSECVIRSNNRTIYTAGRPPWYNCAGQQVEPFVIGNEICRFSLAKILYCLDSVFITSSRIESLPLIPLSLKRSRRITPSYISKLCKILKVFFLLRGNFRNQTHDNIYTIFINFGKISIIV